MKNIINKFKLTFVIAERSQDKVENVTCNYANNYYGDQMCMKTVD